MVHGLNGFLHDAFNADIDRTIETIAGVDEPDPRADERPAELTARNCDRRLAKYRAALDEPDAELGSFIKWIAEVERERKTLQAQLGRSVLVASSPGPRSEHSSKRSRTSSPCLPKLTRPTATTSTRSSAYLSPTTPTVASKSRRFLVGLWCVSEGGLELAARHRR